MSLGNLFHFTLPPFHVGNPAGLFLHGHVCSSYRVLVWGVQTRTYPPCFSVLPFLGSKQSGSQRKQLWHKDSEGPAQNSSFPSVRTELETPGFPRVH